MTTDITIDVQPIVVIVEALEESSEVVVSQIGVAGPPGPIGPAGGQAFEEVWTDPVTDLVINHNLGRYPGVTIIIDDEHVLGDVTYNSINQLTVSFNTPQGPGKVECL